jgi:hypothetical protein
MVPRHQPSRIFITGRRRLQDQMGLVQQPGVAEQLRQLPPVGGSELRIQLGARQLQGVTNVCLDPGEIRHPNR